MALLTNITPNRATAKVTEQTQQQHVDDMLLVAEQRDRQAFSRLFDHYVPKLKAYGLAVQPGATIMAEEVAQEVMIKVWNRAETYNPKVASVNTWVFTLARNARIDYLRKNSRHQSDIDPELVWNELVDESQDPFMAAQQRNNERSVKSGFKELPNDQQQVLSKVYLEGKSHQEAALDLDLPLGTVKSRVRLAMKKLAVVVSGHGARADGKE